MKRNVANEIKEFHGMINDVVSNTHNLPKDIGYTQGLIMVYLMKHSDERIYQKDLEDVLHIRKSSITEHINILEEKNLIVRVCDDDDKRKRYLKPTRKAMGINKAIIETVKSLNDRMIKGIDEDELECFFRVLDKMKGNMDK